MSSKKKDLEIIFNLQWKNGPKKAERSNIVAVYDLPSTTLSWEPFKWYILKNSGSPGDDVKVSYMENGREFPIKSTLDFQTALYAFRKKAMYGEIINLKLERLCNGNKLVGLTPTCDAQTECDFVCKVESAPEWFLSYMAEFKKDILNEIASTITTHTAVFKPSVTHSHYPRKSKSECAKRCRKSHHLDGNEKEVLKTMKLEKKLESKMEKLVSKSKKLKEKKKSLMTRSSDSDAGHSSSKSNSETISIIDMCKMSAAPVRFDETNIPHLMGGEVYRHCWKVINNGLSPWTEDTELHFSWGSSLLEPIERVLACPMLKPGEIGSIEALIHVPKICGRYQMYWHFHHCGRKFGHWLGCEIIVDKMNFTEQLSTSFLRSLAPRIDDSAKAPTIDSEFKTPYTSLLDNMSVLAAKEQIEMDNKSSVPKLEEQIKDLHISEHSSSSCREQSYEGFNKEIEEVIINKVPSKIQIIEKYFDNIDERKSRCHLDVLNNPTDSTQIENSGEKNAGESEDSHSESISKIDEETSSNSTLNDMVMINFPDEVEEQPITGYAYIEIDGIKTAIPKKYLRADYLEIAEEAPEPHNMALREMFCATTRNVTYAVDSLPSRGTDEYGDLPDLKATDDEEDEAPNIYLHKNLASKNESEIPLQQFIFPETFAGGSANGDKKEFVSNVKEVEENKNTYNNVETQEPATFYNQSACSLLKQHIHDEKISLPNPAHLANFGTSYIYPNIDSNNSLSHIPNYQQTPPEFRLKLNPNEPEFPKESVRNSYLSDSKNTNTTNVNGVNPNPQEASTGIVDTERQRTVLEASAPIPSVVSEAMTMASTALKTVVNKIIPLKNEQELGVWINGHWVSTAENSIRENNLKILADMGFSNRDLNASLLSRYDDDLRRVVTELVQ